MRSINRKLNTVFPTGMFMAALFIAIDPSLEYLRVANCGMPDLQVFGPDPEQAVTNIVVLSLALGITQGMFLGDGARTLRIEPGWRVLMASDGLFEAVAPDGRAVGTERVLAVMRNSQLQHSHGLPLVLAKLQRFCGSGPQADDITAIENLCDKSLMAPVNSDRSAAAPEPVTLRDGWHLNLTLHGPRRADTDPVLLFMNQMQELANVEVQQSALFAVLTELFASALANNNGKPRVYGRGIALVRVLCDTVEHEQAGATTKAIYRWR